jgi:hypothetical protein
MAGGSKQKFVLVGSKKITSGPSLRDDVYYFENMAEAGWVKITSIGNENLYFIFKCDAGQEHKGWCKCL